MYDKVKLWLDASLMGGTTPNQVAAFLTDGKEQTDIATGEVKAKGRLSNLQISVCPNSVFVVGSLSKFLYGNNIYTLDRHSTQEALTKLQDTLHLKLNEAKVIGLEFGTNFLMQHPVNKYLDKMGALSRFLQCRFASTSLYYIPRGKKKYRVLCFYDKGAEEKAKGMTLPKRYEEANWLRYEIRYEGRLSYYTGFPKVEASTLTTQEFYRLMVEKWQDFYFSVSKINQIKTNIMEEIKTVKDAREVFFARLLNQSDPKQIGEFVDELKECHVFTDKKYYTRLKRDIQKISNKASVTETDELIKELDDDIRNVGYYL